MTVHIDRPNGRTERFDDSFIEFLVEAEVGEQETLRVVSGEIMVRSYDPWKIRAILAPGSWTRLEVVA